jgi:hypothetical protein
LIEGLWLMLAQPIRSPAGSLWYIYVLFLFYALLPAFHYFTKGSLWLMLVTGVVLHTLPPTRWFMLGGVSEYLLYLTLGFWVALNYQAWVSLLDRYRYFFISGFIVLIEISAAWQPLPKTLLGLSAIPALHALVRMSSLSKSNFLLTMGAYTFSIYLLNNFSIGFVKGLVGKFIPWGGPLFPVVAALMLAGGILLPILIRRKIFSRIAWLEKITR